MCKKNGKSQEGRANAWANMSAGSLFFFIKTGERANKVDEKMANLRREWANAWADMLAGSQQIPADRRC